MGMHPVGTIGRINDLSGDYISDGTGPRPKGCPAAWLLPEVCSPNCNFVLGFIVFKELF